MRKDKILYVPPRGIGDLVFSLPLLHSLHGAFPTAQIEIPIPDREALKQMIDLIGFVKPSEVFLPKPSDDPLAAERWAASQAGNSERRYAAEKRIFEKYLAGRSYDLAIVAKPFAIQSVKSPQITRKDLELTGFDWKKAHMVDGFSAFASCMGIPVSDKFDLMFDRNADLKLSTGASLHLDAPYVVFNLGASGNNRKWPSERYAEISVWLNGNRFRSVLVGTPDEHALAQHIERMGSGLVNLVSPRGCSLDLRNYAILASHSQAVIGIDSGFLHLADATGVPVVGLYGPSNPEKTGPYHNRQNVVSTFKIDKTMEGIRSAEVINKLEGVLKA